MVENNHELSGRWIYYVFQEEVRAKFRKILGGDITPDFALLPNATIEKGGKRTNNDGSYVLFEMMKNGKPRIIKTPDGKRKRKRKNSGQAWLWDTPEINGLYGKKGKDTKFLSKT